MGILEDTYKKTKNIEEKFIHKRVLFIGSESYDSPTICIIEGLNKIGFEILVYKKANINSWFCNTIINNLDNIENNIDFIISNLHWGTQWSLYNNLNHKVPYILIDGDDRSHDDNISDWKNKYNKYCKSYKINPPEEIKDMELSPYRWMNTIGNYKPDKIFMSQKYKINKECIYLPFGIHEQYLKYNKNLNCNHRQYDIINIPGTVHYYRGKITNILNNLKTTYKIFNSRIYGNNDIYNNTISNLCNNDNNIHSWHRWNMNRNYYDILNNGKILISPPVDKYNAPGWESKRPYEALASGCLILFHKQPDFDNSQYPLQELCDICEFEHENYNQMIQKCKYLLQNPEILEQKREECYNNAIKYFTSEPIARYFLWNIIN